MDSLKDILQKKADDIDIDAKQDDLQLAQKELDRLFGGRVKVKKLDEKGKLQLQTDSSEISSEIRFNQIQIMNAINKSSKQKVESIRTRVK